MRTNIDINEKLITKAMKVLKVKTKKEAVELALREVLRDNARLETLKLRGSGWGWEEYERPEKHLGGMPPSGMPPTGNPGETTKTVTKKKASRNAGQSHVD